MKKLIVILLACLTQPLASMHETKVSEEPTVVILYDIHGVLMRLALCEVITTSFKEFCAQPGLALKIGDFFNGKAAENPAMRRMFNCQQPIKETWHVVNQIRDWEYPQFIFSNIGAPTYLELKKKYSNLFYDTEGHGLFVDAHTVPSDNLKMRKPNPEAFEAAKKMVSAQYPQATKIIFIDDSKKNITAACKAGLKGILFSSPEKLRLDLEKELGHSLTA